MNINDNGLITLSNNLAECKISTWGAHIVSYRPKDEENDIFWLGHLNKFDRTGAIRGGVPICWPRVAQEKLNDHLPRHGLARISEWRLQNISAQSERTEVVFGLTPDDKFDLAVSAKLFINISDHLEYCLETTNNGNTPFAFSEALHAYFNISSVDDITIKGLNHHRYKNLPDGNIYTLKDDLKIHGEFDAIFLNHEGNISIEDPNFNRLISIKKSNSATTVVWNPAKDLAEMSCGQFKQFICVEPSNQETSFICLNPGEKHRISMKIETTKLK